MGLDIWRNDYASVLYDYNLIGHCLGTLVLYRENGDLLHLITAIRLCLVRNLANVTEPKLYNHAFSGTKYLIEDYVTQLANCIHYIRTLPLAPADGSGPATKDGKPTASTQMKMNVIHDMRQAYGRSSLVLQGGAIFGLYHLGVIRALFMRGLLPRIITGTATGALIAALVSVHTEEELPEVLSGDAIDLSAFCTGGEGGDGREWKSLLTTLMRRLWRYAREGHFLDVRVLEECLRTNLGDMTFEEAYNRTKRVLNITVATPEDAGIPTLLNHVTAPHVVGPPHDPFQTPGARCAAANSLEIHSLYGLPPWLQMHTLLHSMDIGRPLSSAKTLTAPLCHGYLPPAPSSATGHRSHTQAAVLPYTVLVNYST